MSTWIRGAAAVALVAFALYLRLDGLGAPNYWYDEAISSLRVAGHTEQEVAAFADAHQTFPIGELGQFVHVSPRSSAWDTVRSAASEDPQQTPLYYVTAHLWARIFGSSIEAGRGVAALMSLLALAAMYWLCLELFVKSGAFTSPLVCWVGVLTMALSPYQVAIAREHRPYSLWMLAVTVACASFLRAIRTNTPVAWSLYGVAAALMLYTHLLSVLVLAAFGAFLLIKERFRLTHSGRSFAAASAFAVLTVVPWLLVLVARRTVAQNDLGWVQDYMRGRFQLLVSLEPVIRIADISLWDLQQIAMGLPGFRFAIWFVDLAPLAVLAALWWFARGPRRACAGFASVLIASVSVSFFAIDFLTGSLVSWVYRYGVPTNLGWLIAITFLIAMAIEHPGPWKRSGWAVAAAFVFIAAISAVRTHHAKHTWLKAWDNAGDAAKFLNMDRRAMIVSDDFVGGILTLAAQLRPDTPVSWRARCFACPRALEPGLDIPFPLARPGAIFYFRTWVNVPPATARPLVYPVIADELGDPRFHTRPINLGQPQVNLYLLTPR